MACVILIHAKNWQERNRILTSLDDDICSEVITDLMIYMEKKYKGRFVKDEEVGGDLIQTTSIEPVENKDIPLLESMSQNDQMNETGGNILTHRNTIAPEEDGNGTFIPYRNRMIEPKEENDVAVRAIAGNDIPVISLIESDQMIANTEKVGTVGEQLANECDINPPESSPQLMDIAHNEVFTDVADNIDIPLITHSSPDNENIENDIETDVTCVETVVSDVLLEDDTTNSKPPVTVRIATRSMKRGRNVVEDGDGKADSQKKNTKSSSVDEAPSTSTIRRSGRITRRPAYSMDDEDEDEDDCPAAPTKVRSSSRKRTSEGRSEDRNGIECKKCFKQLSSEYRWCSKAKDHAITHTDLHRYECPVDGCGYKSGHLRSFVRHTRTKHGRLLSAKNINLTDEQEEELNQMVKECFPDLGTRDEYKTCAVCQATVSNNNLNQQHLRRHSLQHIDFMLYKCNQTKCQYEAKHYPAMIEHGRKKHKIEEISKEETGIKLTDDQKKEIDDMFKKCFPITDINNTVTTLIECKKCLKKLNTDYRWYSHAKDHAISHTDLKRYECPVDGCDYKSGHNHTVRDHVRNKHGNRHLPTKNIDLTDEQEEELDRITKECFPDFATRDEYKVCAVCKTAVVDNSLDQQHPKRHSLRHLDFMLYKCNQPMCQYESRYFNEMVKHGVFKHCIKKMSKEETEIDLTDDQKKEIDDMLKKCFPDEKDNEE